MLDNIVSSLFGYLSEFLSMVANNWLFSLIFVIWFLTLLIDFFIPTHKGDD